jgi:hypothetical protein
MPSLTLVHAEVVLTPIDQTTANCLWKGKEVSRMHLGANTGDFVGRGPPGDLLALLPEMGHGDIQVAILGQDEAEGTYGRQARF